MQDCLAREGVHYDMIAHQRTRDSNHTAQAAHIPGDRLAKCVMLEDDKGYLMAVIPASHKVDLGAVHRQLNRALGLATDRELVELFKDCEPGARTWRWVPRCSRSAAPQSRPPTSKFAPSPRRIVCRPCQSDP